MDPNQAAEIWEKVCAHLKARLHPDVFTRWIAVIRPVTIDATGLQLAVDNDFYQSWLEDNYLPLIRDAVSATAHHEVNVHFQVNPVAAPQPSQAPRPSRTPRPVARKPASTLTLNPHYTFDNFIVGPSNSFSHAASLAVAQAPARAYNPLLIYGGSGLGKTHLIQAIGAHVLTSSNASVCYLRSDELLNEYIDALQNKSLVQFRNKYRKTDLLLIDDIHFLAGKERLQEEFFHTFNCLFDAHKQIVMTSDRPASEITGLEQRLVSRFEWGCVTELEPPDLETRVAILRHKQRRAETQLSDDLLFFIAENIRCNIRQLEGALVRSVSYGSMTKQPLTVEILRQILKDLFAKDKEAEVTFDTIQKTVAEHYDIRLADMSSKRRPRSIAVPRQVAMYLCRRLTRSSLPDIAMAFGKNHATVLHACRAVDERMTVDGGIRQEVQSIAQKLGKSI